MSITDIAQSGLTTIQNGQDYINNLATKYVLSPVQALGIAGFVFDYEGDTNVHHQADITDHWTEDNTVINDHIAIKPVRITLSGYVAELALKSPQGVLGALGKVQDILGQVPAYLRQFTPGMLNKVNNAITSATNVVTTVNQSIKRAGNIVGLFTGAQPGPSKQQQAYQTLESLYLIKTVFWLGTPYGGFNNMAIEVLDFTQDKETKTITDIRVTLKQLRFASITYEAYNKDIFDARSAAQRQPNVDLGKTPGTNADASILYQAAGLP